ncbi:uncharacterized protein LOC142356163 [Convolutriloba macropyga]|uniref:uncharacterized protein LOC142356163 n=1 Tax=Convolutriloba macropyga TaxID=536237 RepID=UPI003F52265A
MKSSDAMFIFGLVFIMSIDAVWGTVIGVCNCSIGMYQVLCGSQLQPMAGQLFADFDSLQEVTLLPNYTPFVFSMSRCSLDVISGKPFIKFTNLTRIQISENNITKLESSVFSNLKDLELLNLQDNNIEDFDENAFEGLSFLKILDVSENEIEKLPENIFKSTGNLTKLVLKNNRISSLSMETLKGKRHCLAKIST